MLLKDADKILRLFEKMAWHNLDDRDDAEDAVWQCPTVDAVPVVRCKDCDFWRGDLKTGRAEWGNVTAPCEEWSDPENGHTRYTQPTDFCSYGERKDDGETAVHT